MNVIQRFPANADGRDFIVGDIHGCFDQLRECLSSVAFDSTRDRLFSVGDLVDRGPSSEESIEWIAAPWFHAVRGNHEQMAIGVAAGRHDLGNYLRNGGGWFLSMEDSRQKLYAEAFDSLPYLIEIQTRDGRVGIVHAEIHGDSWDEFAEAIGSAESNTKRKRLLEIALWARTRITHKEVGRIRDLAFLYVGHTPVDAPIELGNVRYIDTGCVFGRRLTLIELDAKQSRLAA